MTYLRKLVKFGTLTALGVFGMMHAIPKIQEARRMRASSRRSPPSREEIDLFLQPPPPREANVDRLIEDNDYFDVLVIGAGATGSGVALDAVTRGLKTCLVEKLDFASGTSSRSTKLLHGGVRYLQKAIFNLDLEQYRMVKEALRERANLIDIAPHTARPLPIMLPVYKFWQVPYYWAGIKMYDIVSGSQILKASYFLNRSRALELFPHLKRDYLKGAIVYYDGQHDDARMCLDIIFTAARLGAVVANYTEVIEILKGPFPQTNLATGPSTNPKTVVTGVRLRDELTGREFVVHAKCIVNATGPFTDHIRQLDDQHLSSICQPSSGVHIVLPGYYSPKNMGLLDPSTTDGRVIFFLPWMNGVVAGTTDNSCEISHYPAPSEDEVNFILNEIKNYLSPEIIVRRGDVMSAWAGIRPLVCDPNSMDTQSITRNHVIEVSKDNMITIVGGKWTTYRSMAEETVDKCIEVCGLKPQFLSGTRGLLLDGGYGWNPSLSIQLAQEFGLDYDVATHLATSYGGKSILIARSASLTGQRWPLTGKRLHPDYPFIEAEIVWACKEYARHAIDFVARRVRLSFLNVYAAEEVLPRIIEVMGSELNWSKNQRKRELEMANLFLSTEMGLSLKASGNIPINLSSKETDEAIANFHVIDSDKKGYITLNDLRKFFYDRGEKLAEDKLESILREIDLNKNGEIDIGEFMQFMSSLKTGVVVHSSLKQILGRPIISVDRSGGGV